MDRAWWNTYGARLERNSDSELWTTNREAARVYSLQHINGEPGDGVPKRHNAICLGGNSGYQAVALAIHFGAARIVLLGYDMRNAGKLKHWHGDHVGLGNPLPAKFAPWIASFRVLAAAVPGVAIVNASRETALDCFPRVTIESALVDTRVIKDHTSSIRTPE